MMDAGPEILLKFQFTIIPDNYLSIMQVKWPEIFINYAGPEIL